MNVRRVTRAEVSSYGIHAAGSAGGRFSDSFRQQMDRRGKEEFQRRASALFDEIVREASAFPDHVSLQLFEKHRRLIRELLSDAAENAYELCLERACDGSGTQRMYAVVRVVDRKLDELARALLSESRDYLGYIGRVDEIRGLIMDLFS